MPAGGWRPRSQCNSRRCTRSWWRWRKGWWCGTRTGLPAEDTRPSKDESMFWMMEMLTCNHHPHTHTPDILSWNSQPTTCLSPPPPPPPSQQPANHPPLSLHTRPTHPLPAKTQPAQPSTTQTLSAPTSIPPSHTHTPFSAPTTNQPLSSIPCTPPPPDNPLPPPHTHTQHSLPQQPTNHPSLSLAHPPLQSPPPPQPHTHNRHSLPQQPTNHPSLLPPTPPANPHQSTLNPNNIPNHILLLWANRPPWWGTWKQPTARGELPRRAWRKRGDVSLRPPPPTASWRRWCSRCGGRGWWRAGPHRPAKATQKNNNSHMRAVKAGWVSKPMLSALTVAPLPAAGATTFCIRPVRQKVLCLALSPHLPIFT